MKFLYYYKTSSNERREGVVVAPDREAAYADLRKRGIRPYRVEDAPGFFNRLFGRGKRWMTIAALSVALGVTIVLAVQLSAEPRVLPRQQIAGDQFILEEGLATQWADVLTNPGERWLAMYAMPGRKPRKGLKVSSPIEIYVAIRDLSAHLDKPVALAAVQFPEYRQLRAIVEGMKAELRTHLAGGKDILSYLELIDRRQNDESKEYTDAVATMRKLVNEQGCGEDVRKTWIRMNEELRAKGLMALPGPERF